MGGSEKLSQITPPKKVVANVLRMCSATKLQLFFCIRDGKVKKTV